MIHDFMITYSWHILFLLIGISGFLIVELRFVMVFFTTWRELMGKKNDVNPKNRSQKPLEFQKGQETQTGHLDLLEANPPIGKATFFSKNLCFTCCRRCNSIAWHPQCKGTPPFEGGHVSALQCLMLDAWWWVWLEIRSHFCEVQSEKFISTWFNETSPEDCLFGCFFFFASLLLTSNKILTLSPIVMVHNYPKLKGTDWRHTHVSLNPWIYGRKATYILPFFCFRMSSNFSKLFILFPNLSNQTPTQVTLYDWPPHPLILGPSFFGGKQWNGRVFRKGFHVPLP